ncbi:MAG TPA: N-acetyltransferase [Bifidobacterium sp.]|nr:N-acetyltransferase [Bifidobacterium sp.]
MKILQYLHDALCRSDRPDIDVPRFIRSQSLNVPIGLRPLTAADCDEWNEVRWRNDAWLGPWESGDPLHGASISFDEWIRMMRRNERAGTGVVFAIEHDGRIVGQISLGAICYGAMRTGIVGYWIDERCAGRGYAPMAVALLADWAMLDATGPRLHRMEIDILPENERSRRVVAKVGARFEGVRKAYMYVNGRWRDHESYALLAGDAPGGFTARLMRE